MNISYLIAQWPLGVPDSVGPAVTGGNNLSYPVTVEGARYFLRVYQNTVNATRIGYEHTLLQHLERSGLSFALPAPIVARSGSTIVRFDDRGESKIAALFSFIPGQQPRGVDPEELRVCGAALAELDEALSRIDLPAPAETFPPFGQYLRDYPLETNPQNMFGELPLGPSQWAELARIIGALCTRVPELNDRLPVQIVHRDFDASNVLVEEGRVTGVLDFEFAGPDWRCLDLARSLAQFTRSPWSSPERWVQMTAFGAGYLASLHLTATELEALPDMMRLYRATSLLHRESRRRQGLASAVDVVQRVEMLLQADEWLAQHHTRLIESLDESSRSK